MKTEIKNAIITHAKIEYGDRGFLQVWLTLDYGGCSQGFGGYVLYLPKSFDHHSVESFAGHHIYRCMEIAGVDVWDRITGKSIRVSIKDGLIDGIGHIIKDDWYYPSIDFKKDGDK